MSDDLTPIPVSPEALRALARWEGALSDPTLSAGHWEGGDRLPDGSIQMPWFDRSAVIDRFGREMAACGMVRSVGWMDWAGTERGRSLMVDPAAVASASPDELVCIVTATIRGERFADGTIEAAVEHGVLLAAARRAAALLGERPADGR